MRKLILSVSLFALLSANCAPDQSGSSSSADTEPPVLAVSSPTNGQEVGSSFQISGTVVDSGSGVEKVTIRVADDAAVIVNPENGSFSYNASRADFGPFSITITASDIAGNTTPETVIALSRLAVPVVIITNPSGGTVFTASTVLVTGTATVEAPSAIASVQVQNNGGAWNTVAGLLSWSNTVTLDPGSNTILVRAVSDGHKTNISEPLTVVYSDSVYVSVTGSDTNAGYLKSAPLRSLPAAVALAGTLGITNIRAAAGTYTPGSGLQSVTNGLTLTNRNNIHFTGGYNAGFTTADGTSVLDGAGLVFHVLYLHYVTNITFNGFTFTGGNANGTSINSYGAGAYISYAVRINLTNIILTSNTASSIGGGFYLVNCKDVSLYGEFSYNTAPSGGAGYLMPFYNSTNYLGGRVHNNTATSGGGLFLNATRTGFLFRPGTIITSNSNHGLHLWSNEDCFPNTGVVDWGPTNWPGNIHSEL